MRERVGVLVTLDILQLIHISTTKLFLITAFGLSFFSSCQYGKLNYSRDSIATERIIRLLSLLDPLQR